MYMPVTTEALFIQLVPHVLGVSEESSGLLHKPSAHFILTEHLESAHLGVDLADLEVCHMRYHLWQFPTARGAGCSRRNNLPDPF